jgi:hypothetical protein
VRFDLAVSGPNVRSMAVDFWRRFWNQLALSQAVTLEHRPDDETRIEIDHRLPHLALRGTAPARYRVTTKRLFLRADYFPDRDLRRRIGSDAAKARNRALFCEDLRSREVLSAHASTSMTTRRSRYTYVSSPYVKSTMLISAPIADSVPTSCLHS